MIELFSNELQVGDETLPTSKASERFGIGLPCPTLFGTRWVFHERGKVGFDNARVDEAHRVRLRSLWAGCEVKIRQVRWL
jgi:hypothetical protein